MKKSLALLKRLDPKDNRVTRVLCMVAVMTVGITPAAFAQSGIPIMDGILQFIQDYKGVISMVGVAVFGVGLLTRLVAPDWSRDHKPAFVSMILGGIVLSMVDEIATLIVGA